MGWHGRLDARFHGKFQQRYLSAETIRLRKIQFKPRARLPNARRPVILSCLEYKFLGGGLPLSIYWCDGLGKRFPPVLASTAEIRVSGATYSRRIRHCRQLSPIIVPIFWFPCTYYNYEESNHYIIKVRIGHSNYWQGEAEHGACTWREGALHLFQ